MKHGTVGGGSYCWVFTFKPQVGGPLWPTLFKCFHTAMAVSNESKGSNCPRKVHQSAFWPMAGGFSALNCE